MSDPRVSDVLVQDCGEALVDTHGAITAWMVGPDDGSLRWVRSSVKDRLVKAAELLRPAYILALNEGWRSPTLQSLGFDRHVRRLAIVYPMP
jgi:hypothetical protein